MRTILFYILVFLSNYSFAQSNIQLILDTVLTKTQEVSLYSSSVNWDTLKKYVYIKAKDAQTINDLKPAFELLLNSLRDHHGRIVSSKDYSNLAYFTNYKNHRHPDNRAKEMDVWKIVNDIKLSFEYKVLKDNVGYLKIVGIPPNVDIEKESKKFALHLQNFQHKK